MNLGSIKTETRWITRTNTATFSDADIERETNIVYGKLALKLLILAGYTAPTGGIVKHDLLSTSGLSEGDLGYNGEYPFDSTWLDIDKIEVSYDGSNYYDVEIIDLRDRLASSFEEDEYNAVYSQDQPKAFLFRDSLFLRPTKSTSEDVTDGIKLMVQKRQTALSGDSSTPNFEANLHDIIPLEVAMRYFTRNPKKYNALIKSQLDEARQLFNTYYEDKFPLKLQLKSQEEEF